MNRNRLPRWINGIIDHVADAPMSPLGRLAARRYGEPVPGTPATSFDEDASVRVLITPVNYSGQGFAWARALEASDPRISARNTAIDVPGGFSFDADLVVPIPVYHNDADWQRRELDAARRATHVLIEAEEPPFGRLLGRSVAAQAEELSRCGVSVAYLAHGTDVRLPSRHMRDNRWSHYADPEIYTPRYEDLARRNIALLEASGRPVFVSTPDLLEDLPTATWCPVVVDPQRWERKRPQRVGPLRVAHAPSVGAVKGTELILPTLRALETEGVIELALVRGVPSAEMPEIFAAADVVIDQVRIGSYGVAACEAMAAGCVVVGHASPRVRDRVRTLTGRALPIVEADPDSIGRVLRELASADITAHAAESRAFVHAVHNGEMSARVLRDSWIAVGTPRSERTDDAPRT